MSLRVAVGGCGQRAAQRKGECGDNRSHGFVSGGGVGVKSGISESRAAFSRCAS